MRLLLRFRLPKMFNLAIRVSPCSLNPMSVFMFAPTRLSITQTTRHYNSRLLYTHFSIIPIQAKQKKRKKRAKAIFRKTHIGWCKIPQRAHHPCRLLIYAARNAICQKKKRQKQKVYEGKIYTS